MDNKLDNILDGIDAVSNILAVANPAFCTIPIFTYSVKRAVGLISGSDIIERIKRIQKQLEKKKITTEEFKGKIFKLDEHGRYYITSAIQNIIMNCPPETVDIYISIMIDYIMKEQHGLEEELCEIIKNMNPMDLFVFQEIKTFMQKGDKTEYNIRLSKKIKEDEDNNKTNNSRKIIFRDRNIILDEHTIFWKDYSNYVGFPDAPLNYLSLFEAVDENKKETYIGALEAKSIVKLDEMGLIQLDYVSTLGTVNKLNIDRFHITIIGKKFLNYI